MAGNYALLACIYLNYIRLPYASAMGLASYFAYKNLLKKFDCYKEHRADTEAAYATQCYHCVTEATLHLGYTRPGGYLSQDEFKEIAQELQSKNMICEYHKNLKKDPEALKKETVLS